MSENAAASTPLNVAGMTTVNIAFFKDLGDMIRARTLFFFPFYGAFLTFLFAKSQYIIDTSVFIQVEIFATFGLGLIYAYTVSQFLYNIESVRMLFGIKFSNPDTAGPSFTQAEQDAISAILRTFVPNIEAERRLFKWTMYMLWTATAAVLFDIFLSKTVERLALIAASEISNALSWQH